jgi:hypothetical protein
VKEIQGKARTVRELLKGVKYSIDYYQREYKWRDAQIEELVKDLTDQFLEDYVPGQHRSQVRQYGHYFLGSIIVSSKDDANYIVDGQQRLTSLTLFLVLLRNIQKDRDTRVNVDELIASEKYGETTFNLHVAERVACMRALFDQQSFDPTDQTESVQNLHGRYQDLERRFPPELRDEALPFFIDWLLENVHLVEITAYSDDDAYTIFEAMNDRGLRLSPTDMLKGYLLANIDDGARRAAANGLWRDRVHDLNAIDKEVEPDFFKAWFRSQYAKKIRERRAGATPEDFERIGTAFHRWLRDAEDDVGLKHGSDFARFIERNFDFYSKVYLRLMQASASRVDGLEHVLYNAHHGFTLQYLLLLAPLSPDDADDVVRLKLRLVGRFVDILLTRRIWNFRSIAYSTMQYAMFLVMRDIRGLAPVPLAKKLYAALAAEQATFASNDNLRVHQQNRYALHRVLARLTDHVETQSGGATRYAECVAEGRSRYEVEHIWANFPDRHKDEFAHPSEFADYRNRIGGLLLLPKSFNASYGAMVYDKKRDHYLTQNLLARSLHEGCYDHNPGFLQFVQRSALPFKAHKDFKKADLQERSALYRGLAEQVWNPDALLREVGL